LPADAILCVACGYDKRTGHLRRTETVVDDGSVQPPLVAAPDEVSIRLPRTKPNAPVVCVLVIFAAVGFASLWFGLILLVLSSALGFLLVYVCYATKRTWLRIRKGHPEGMLVFRMLGVVPLGRKKIDLSLYSGIRGVYTPREGTTLGHFIGPPLLLAGMYLVPAAHYDPPEWQTTVDPAILQAILGVIAFLAGAVLTAYEYLSDWLDLRGRFVLSLLNGADDPLIIYMGRDEEEMLMLLEQVRQMLNLKRKI
jgi:hypothetical protein